MKHRTLIALMATLHLHANTDLENQLLAAAQNGNVSQVYFVINHFNDHSALGSSINCTNELGQAPLMLATLGGHLEIVQVLLAHHADVSLTDTNGNTALHYLAMAESWFQVWGDWDRYKSAVNLVLESIKRLRNKKTILNCTNYEGLSAFMWAVKNNEDFLVKELINFGLIKHEACFLQTFILEIPDATDFNVANTSYIQELIEQYRTKKKASFDNKDCLLL